MQQFLQTSDYADDGRDNNTIAYVPTSRTTHTVPGGRTYTVDTYIVGGDMMAEITRCGA